MKIDEILSDIAVKVENIKSIIDCQTLVINEITSDHYEKFSKKQKISINNLDVLIICAENFLDEILKIVDKLL